mmetsp:Transcript_70596/g.163179  ORF Transcript_70596/g.163179 Transcript_70596/m.163179 type:complete len:145 (+) Transcript_70596:167-601(+)
MTAATFKTTTDKDDEGKRQPWQLSSARATRTSPAAFSSVTRQRDPNSEANTAVSTRRGEKKKQLLMLTSGHDAFEQISVSNLAKKHCLTTMTVGHRGHDRGHIQDDDGQGRRRQEAAMAIEFRTGHAHKPRSILLGHKAKGSKQ